MNKFKNKKSIINNSYISISILGKSYRLNITYTNYDIIKMVNKNNEIYLFLPNEYKGKDNMEIVNSCIRDLYDEIAKKEIENSMELARHILNFAPEDYLIKRINEGFYKTSKKVIIVSPDIVQYSRETINVTILQAFCKTKYKVNTNMYKELLTYALKSYEEYNNKIEKVS